MTAPYTQTGPEAGVSARLTAQFTAVRAELVRVDAKASVLLAVAGVALSAELAILGRTHLPLAATIAGWVAAVTVGSSVALLTSAVRPQLGGDHGFVRLARVSGEQLLADDDPDPVDPDQLIWLARLARRKFVLVQHAVDLLRLTIPATALTSILTALG